MWPMVRSLGKDSLAIWKKVSDLYIVVSSKTRQSKDFADGLEKVSASLAEANRAHRTSRSNTLS